MRLINTCERYAFDNLAELKRFIVNDGTATYYNGEYGEYDIVRLDEHNKLVLGTDGWCEVEGGHLDGIIGLKPINQK